MPGSLVDTRRQLPVQAPIASPFVTKTPAFRIEPFPFAASTLQRISSISLNAPAPSVSLVPQATKAPTPRLAGALADGTIEPAYCVPSIRTRSGLVPGPPGWEIWSVLGFWRSRPRPLASSVRQDQEPSQV